MKKMIMILMMVFGLSAAFAKPVVLNVKSGGEYCTLISDDENEQKDFSGMSDTDIVEMVKGCVPPNVKGTNDNLIYCGFIFNETLNDLIKEYYTYWLLRSDGLYVDVNIGDGRMLRLVYVIEKDNEYNGANPFSIEK